MFSLASGLYHNYLATPQLNVLMVGCEGVGKTALLERLKVTQFSVRPTAPNDSPRKLTRNISCPGPRKYKDAKDADDEDNNIIMDSSSERPQTSERWIKEGSEGKDSEADEKLMEDKNNDNNDEVPSEQFDVKAGQTMLPMIKIRPTMGQNLAKISITGAKCHIFDISGKFQDLWERYYPDAEAVIFCWKIPSTHEFDNEQRQVLEQVRKNIPDDVPFLIFGHLMENDASLELLPTSTEHFLPNYHSNVVQLYYGSAKSGKGVREAMEWLIPLAKRHAKLRAAAPTPSSEK